MGDYTKENMGETERLSRTGTELLPVGEDGDEHVRQEYEQWGIEFTAPKLDEDTRYHASYIKVG